MTAPRDPPCTACSFLLDRLEYAIHLLDQVLESDQKEGRAHSVRYLEHEIEHLHGVATTARAAGISPVRLFDPAQLRHIHPVSRPPPMRLHVVPPDLLGGVDGDTGDGP